MKSQFNLYYLHWWTLTHFVFQSPKYQDRALSLAEHGGDLATFEQTIGPVEQVQREWHAYVRSLKASLAGTDLKFFRTGKVPEGTNSPPGP